MAGIEPDIDASSQPRGQEARERALAILATRQQGMVARRQLVSLGFKRGAIQRRLAAGRMHGVHPGVYAVGHEAIPPRGWWMAAVLACGPGALLSHRSAAALWELRSSASANVEVTEDGRNRRNGKGIVVHHARYLDPEDRTRRHGIPVTTVARTLLDLAEVLPARQLERAFEEAERLRLLDLGAVNRACERNPGRHGLRPLRALLAHLDADPPSTRSELERRFLELCETEDLPAPTCNAPVAGLEVDAVWLDRGLVVELDGHAYHRTRAAFERDRARDAKLQLAGFRVVRITYRRLETDPAGVAETVRALLGGA